jgi:hypothetical protein
MFKSAGISLTLLVVVDATFCVRGWAAVKP